MDENQMERIAALKRRAQDAAGGHMVAWEPGKLSPDQSEKFWKAVVDYETAPSITKLQQLIDAGIELPEPDAMDDAALSANLWEVIHALAKLRVFLDDTDHLSDRELYAWLWQHGLREEVPLVDDGASSACYLSPIGGCSESDIWTALKYYADEEWRQQWLVDFPDYEMPDSEEAPYDRDQHLPLPPGVILVPQQ
jgi:hypothetical protein